MAFKIAEKNTKAGSLDGDRVDWAEMTLLQGVLTDIKKISVDGQDVELYRIQDKLGRGHVFIQKANLCFFQSDLLKEVRITRLKENKKYGKGKGFQYEFSVEVNED